MENKKFVGGLMCALAVSALLVSFSAAADGPCAKIRVACQAGGKNPPMACVRTIVDGGKVPGVVVDASTVAACKEKKDKRGARKAARDAKEAAQGQ